MAKTKEQTQFLLIQLKLQIGLDTGMAEWEAESQCFSEVPGQARAPK